MPLDPNRGIADPIDPVAETRIIERSVALFLLGVIAFSPPLIAVFAVAHRVLGIPMLYLYVFGMWALIVLLQALIARGAEVAARRPPPVGED